MSLTTTAVHDAHTPPRDAAVRRMSRMLAFACAAMAVLIPAAAIWVVASMPAEALAARLGTPAAPVDGAARAAVVLLLALPAALMGWALLRLRRCFAEFAGGRWFAAAAVADLRRFAGWSVASVVAGVLAGPAATMVLAVGRPGPHALTLELGSGQLSALLVGGMVWVVSRILEGGMALERANAALARENALLAEENAGFV